MKDNVLRVKDVVASVLEVDHRARNNDKWLNLVVLRAMGFHIYIPYNELERMPSFESISRCRRKFQEEGFYPADIVIKNNRSIEERDMEKISSWFK